MSNKPKGNPLFTILVFGVGGALFGLILAIIKILLIKNDVDSFHVQLILLVIIVPAYIRLLLWVWSRIKNDAQRKP